MAYIFSVSNNVLVIVEVSWSYHGLVVIGVGQRSCGVTSSTTPNQKPEAQKNTLSAHQCVIFKKEKKNSIQIYKKQQAYTTAKSLNTSESSRNSVLCILKCYSPRGQKTRLATARNKQHSNRRPPNTAKHAPHGNISSSGGHTTERSDHKGPAADTT